ncbi:MAG TPA: hypothetical protein VF594_12420 [Rubricoccaceae bacterium]
MPAHLSDADLDRAAQALGVAAERSPDGRTVSYALADAASGRRLAIDIVRTEAGSTVVKVYGPAAHLELHNCTGVVSTDDLGEALFFSRDGGRVSGLVIERAAACSLFANVEERLLTADYFTIAPDVAHAAVVLSMAETAFENDEPA